MSNLRARDALERAHRLFSDRPSAARKPNSPATAVLRDGLRCEVTGPAGEKVVTDMPTPMGGEASGPNPGWLLRASMASCTATAIAMRAAMLGIEIREMEVSVHSVSDARGLVGFNGVPACLADMRMSIKLSAENVPEGELRELARWAAKESPVSSTLREGSAVEVEVSVG